MKKVFVLLIMFLSIFICGKVCAYKSYKVGDEVTYNDIDFYVIKDSNEDEDSVTLLKAEPLSVEEVNLYGDGHVNMLASNNASYYQNAYNVNGYGGMSYQDQGSVGKSNYENSAVKYVVDTWADSNFKNQDIISKRLLNYDDIINDIGYDKNNIIYGWYISVTDKIPTWFYNEKYWYWTMVPNENYDYELWVVTNEGHINTSSAVGNFNIVVRPVVELYKCAIDDTCDNNDSDIINDNDDNKEINDNKSDDKKEIEKSDINVNKNESTTKVKVPNTLKSVSGLIILVGLVLVCAGLNIFIIIKNKDRKKD